MQAVVSAALSSFDVATVHVASSRDVCGLATNTSSLKHRKTSLVPGVLGSGIPGTGSFEDPHSLVCTPI